MNTDNGLLILGLAFIAIGILATLADIDWNLRKEIKRRRNALLMRSAVQG